MWPTQGPVENGNGHYYQMNYWFSKKIKDEEYPNIKIILIDDRNEYIEYKNQVVSRLNTLDQNCGVLYLCEITFYRLLPEDVKIIFSFLKKWAKISLYQGILFGTNPDDRCDKTFEEIGIVKMKEFRSPRTGNTCILWWYDVV